jgi:iron complex transport system substrate-binding protein
MLGAAFAADCSRLVTISPSLTEVVITLGLQDRLVGVSRFDSLLKSDLQASRNLSQIGGFLDLNRELLIALKPSIILGLKESQEMLRPVARMGQRVELFDHSSLEGINQSVKEVAELCAMVQMADSWLAKTAQGLSELRKQSLREITSEQRRGIVVISSSGGAGFYLSGSDGYYSQLLEELGLENIYNQQTRFMGDVSAEGIIAMAPHFIIEIIEPGSAPSLANYLTKHLGPQIPAFREGRVFSISDDYAGIPGPLSYPKLAERIANKIREGFNRPS